MCLHVTVVKWTYVRKRTVESQGFFFDFLRYKTLSEALRYSNINQWQQIKCTVQQCTIAEFYYASRHEGTDWNDRDEFLPENFFHVERRLEETWPAEAT